LPPKEDFDDTLERDIKSTAKSNAQIITDDKTKQIPKSQFKAQTKQNKENIDDELDRQEYEEELLRKHDEQRISIKHSELAESSQAANLMKDKASLLSGNQRELFDKNKHKTDAIIEDEEQDRIDFEEELLRQQKIKQKITRDEPPVENIEQKIKVNPPVKTNTKTDIKDKEKEEKLKRDEKLKLIKQKQAQTKSQQVKEEVKEEYNVDLEIIEDEVLKGDQKLGERDINFENRGRYTTDDFDQSKVQKR